MKYFKHFCLGFMAAISGAAMAATVFNVFQPATGVLKGSATSYVTTAAVSTDITALWTGTCNGTTFLNGAGACATPSSSPALTATDIGYGSAGNVLTGTSDFTWTDSTETLTFGNGATGPIIAAAAGNTTGTNFQILAGSGGGSGTTTGGALVLAAGTGGANGNGGVLDLFGGNTNKANSNTAGAVVMTGGGSTGFPGAFGNFQNGGAVTVSGGLGSGDQSSASGGNLILQGGAVQLEFASGSTTATAGTIAFNTQTTTTISSGAFTGSYTQRMLIDDKGNVIVNANHSYTGTNPTISACGTASVDSHSTNSSGTVTPGTASSCTITFGSAYTTWNHCNVTSQTVLTTFAYSYTLSAITVTATALAGGKIDYRCDGQ